MTAPLTGMAGPETSAAEQSRMELQAKLNGLGGLNGRQLNPEAKAKKLREACEGFESIFIQKMWQEMRNAVPKTGILSGREERFWQDMYDQELSKSMTKAGGIGLADMMYEQLSRNLVSASRSAAGSAQGAAFAPGAAPLVPEESSDELSLGNPVTASVYDGEAPETGVVAQAEKPAPEVAKPAPEALKPEPEPVKAQAAAVPPLTAPVQVAETPKEHKRVHKADLGQSSGLLQAQKARREAGDKLGSRAVRPSQRKNRKVEQEEQSAPVQAAEIKPGSAEALKAAVEMARTGAAPAENAAQPVNLANMVANVQAMQAGQAVQTAQAETAKSAEEPTTRKVRFTTNVPKQASLSNKKTKQAIRMLNVDNVGVNSKQGKGLEAYHAQQEAVKAAGQAQSAAGQPLAAQQAEQPAPIPPLTPKSQPVEAPADGNFAIPPLTVADSHL